MAGRSGRRRVDPSSPLVDLDTVFADDALIDAIAARPWGPAPRDFGGTGRSDDGSARVGVLTVSRPTLDPLMDMLETWREELAATPIPLPPRAARPDAPVARQRAAQSRSRALRPAVAIAAAIAALLVGSASIGSKDAPRDSPLFALTQVLWPSRAASVASADQVGAILIEARSALDDGRQQDAQLALLRAAAELGRVDDVDGKGDMQQQVAELWVEAAPLTPTTPTGTQNAGTGTPGAGGSHPSAELASPTPVAAAQAAAGQAAAQADAAQAVAAQAAAAQLAAAQLAAGLAVGGQQNGGQALAPVSPTGLLQAALGAASIAGSATPPSAVAGSATGAVSAPAGSAGAISSAADPTSAGVVATAPSVPSTPPQPAPPVDPPATVTASGTPSATEQSPPAPTPSAPTGSPQTAAPNGSGPLAVDDTAAGPASGTRADSKVASIPLDPATTG